MSEDKNKTEKRLKIRGDSFGFLKIILPSLFVLFILFLGLLIPLTAAFAPVFWRSTIDQIQNAESPHVIWKNGSQNPSEADFAILIDIQSIDIKAEQSFKISSDITAPIVNKSSVIVEHEFVPKVYDFSPGKHSTYFDSRDFSNYSEEISYGSYGTPQTSPFDFYYFYLIFPNLGNVSVLEKDQIFVKISCSNRNWNIKFYETSFTLDDLLIVFGIQRIPVVMIAELLIPLISLSGIFIIAFMTNPRAEFLKEIPLDRKNSSEQPSLFTKKKEDQLNSDISHKRKFRIDTAKWILAFGVANILFNESIFVPFSVKTTVSISCLILSALFYLSSLYQGKNKGATFNIIIAALSLGIFSFAIIFPFVIFYLT